MINITTENNIVYAAVLGEFTIADFHEFEGNLLHAIQFQGTANLLMDLRDMLGFTIDVAWEEVHFSREHANELGKIAILTSSQWVAWSAWFDRLFTGADVELFNTLEAAEAWLKGNAA